MTVPYSSVTRRQSASRVQRPLWVGLQCFSLAWREQTSMFFAISYDTDYWSVFFSGGVASKRQLCRIRFAGRQVEAFLEILIRVEQRTRLSHFWPKYGQ